MKIYIVLNLVFANSLLLGSLCAQDYTYKKLRFELRTKSPSERVQTLESFISEADPAQDDRVRAVDRLCRELASLGQCTKAETWVEKGKLWANEIDAKFVLMKLYQIEAAIACDLTQYQRGEVAASTSIAMAEDSPWKSFAVFPLVERGICRTHLNNYVLAVEDFEKAIEIANRKNREDWKLNALTNLASTFGCMGQPDKEMETLLKALPIAKQVEDARTISTLVANIGNNLLTNKRFDEAKAKFEEALKIAEKEGFLRLQAIASTGLGDVMARQDDLQTARVRFREAMELYRTLDDRLGIVQIKSRLSAIDSALNVVSSESQIAELSRLLVEAQEMGNRELVISLLDQLIVVHKGERNWEKTLELLDKRQAIEREIWSQESRQANEQLISNRKRLVQQKQTSYLLIVACLGLIVLAAVAISLWHYKRIAADRLKEDNESIRRTQMQKLSEQQEIAQREKSESIAMMSVGIIHDFNNFLSAIVSSAELGRLFEDPSKKDELFESILNTGMSASELTRNLSDFIGHGKISNSHCELHSVIQDEKEFLCQLVDAKVNVNVLTDSCPVWVNFDAVEIKQILSNLIKNSGEAINDRIGKIEIETQVDFEGLICRLIVRDNGVGMDAEMIARSTDPFYSSKGVGRGLGLASVKGIVERNSGKISIDSEPGRGCEIQICMSIVKAGDSLDQAGPRSQDSDELVFDRILLVEDDDSIRSRVELFLEKKGSSVVATDSVEKAIEFVEKSDFDCVVTDFLLADQSGRFLAKNVKAISPDTPILLVSGYAEKDVFESELFDDFVPKPFRMNQLFDALNGLAARMKNQSESKHFD